MPPAALFQQAQAEAIVTSADNFRRPYVTTDESNAIETFDPFCEAMEDIVPEFLDRNGKEL
jgi:hypothetical protein